MQLDRSWTFDTFVPTAGSELALEAARVVAQSPGDRYNPLYIWGGSAVGKSHLLTAIANKVIELFPKKGYVYVGAEEFTNSYTAAVMDRATATFRERFRQTDVLLIDNLQFLERKTGTQEQLLHTLEDRLSQGRATVFAASTPPKDLDFDPRLVSLISGGLVVDLMPPVAEEMRQVLGRYVERWEADNLTPEVVDFVAEGDFGSVRERQGALIRVSAAANLQGEAATQEMALAALTGFVEPDHDLEDPEGEALEANQPTGRAASGSAHVVTVELGGVEVRIEVRQLLGAMSRGDGADSPGD